MSDNEGVLFIPYSDTVDLLSAKEALKIAEDVYPVSYTHLTLPTN